jgi:hypothetical protein
MREKEISDCTIFSEPKNKCTQGAQGKIDVPSEHRCNYGGDAKIDLN